MVLIMVIRASSQRHS